MAGFDGYVLTSDENDAIAARLRAGHQRVQRVDLPGGRVVWIKQVERLHGLLRLQKGDPAKGFLAERAAIRALDAAGLPGPVLLDEGPEHMVLADAGPNLEHLLAEGAWPHEAAQRAFVAVGAALAAVHRAGYAHGRPALRDFCWAEGRLTMIDLERFKARRRRLRTQALDVVIFVHSWFARRNGKEGQTDLLDLALRSYRASAPLGAWQAMKSWARLLVPLAPLARVVLRFRPHSREVRALVWSLDYLARLDDPA